MLQDLTERNRQYLALKQLIQLNLETKLPNGQYRHFPAPPEMGKSFRDALAGSFTDYSNRSMEKGKVIKIPWDQSFVQSNRAVWLKIHGVLVGFWDSNVFQIIAEKFGRVLFLFECSLYAKNFSFGRICILTSRKEIINLNNVGVCWRKISFKVCIQEDGYWQPPYCDDDDKQSEEDEDDNEDGVSDTYENNNDSCLDESDSGEEIDLPKLTKTMPETVVGDAAPIANTRIEESGGYDIPNETSHNLKDEINVMKEYGIYVGSTKNDEDPNKTIIESLNLAQEHEHDDMDGPKRKNDVCVEFHGY
ncbi:unnamed protein product [Lactuca virosa]|uniref:DUF4283 domain-containing protein n=1 Tax=Lactuca virosa TaxID=75947 RepID=A0AAU9M6I5_9ASTR|nr:unnamed protein product [Lactuca virosa]